MLNPQLRRTAERILPRFIIRALDPFEARIADEIGRFAAALAPRSLVLDAGAGEARHRTPFTRHQYVAVDNAQGDAAWNYSALDVIADLDRLPLSSGAFDAAINIVVLEHMREPVAALMEIGRVLRPGGRLLVVAPQEWEIHQAPHDYYRYTRFGLTYVLERSGFHVQRLEPIGGFFWLMARRSVNLLGFFQGGIKWLIFLLLAPVFGLILPLVFYLADRLDRSCDFTLGYVCEAER